MDNFKFKPTTSSSYDFLSDTSKEQPKQCSKATSSNAFVSVHVTSSVRSYTVHSAKSSSTVIKFKDVTKKS